jgi:hypothetical protein
VRAVRREGRAQRVGFGVHGDVALRVLPVLAAGQQSSVLDQHRAGGPVATRVGLVRGFQREAHPVQIVVRRDGHGGFTPFDSGSAR